MCGIIGLLLNEKHRDVHQLLFDGLTVLQHRGQDAAGMVTLSKHGRLKLRKNNGLVRDVFQQHHMNDLADSHVGIGHVRYPTAGSSKKEEAQPFNTNYPFGICVAHNGNLTNTSELVQELQQDHHRHVNTDSDSEVLLNVFAEALTKEMHVQEKPQRNDSSNNNMADVVFAAMQHVTLKCQGGYAGVCLINGVGLVGFRDPNGIRPLVLGVRSANGKDAMECVHATNHEQALDYCIASESVAIDTLGFKLVR